MIPALCLDGRRENESKGAFRMGGGGRSVSQASLKVHHNWMIARNDAFMSGGEGGIHCQREANLSVSLLFFWERSLIPFSLSFVPSGRVRGAVSGGAPSDWTWGPGPEIAL